MADAPIDYRLVLDNLSAGVLVLNSQGNLIYENKSALRLMSSDLIMIRTEGWPVLEMLIDANSGNFSNAQEIRAKAQQSEEPVRFSMLISGTYTPCAMSSFKDSKGQYNTQIIINSPDWSALTELMQTFRSEARDAIADTSGHADFARRILQNPAKGSTAEDLAKKTMGMIDLITDKMYRLELLVDLLHRLEMLRTGQLMDVLENQSRKIDIEDFMEDFVEEINDHVLIDPKESNKDYRQRITLDMDDSFYVKAPKGHLKNIMRDLLRNALLYSEPDTPITIRVESTSQGRLIQFEVKDQGYGIREKETGRVFEPFQRARQPQVMREHGYGLSLYLAKSEVEAMGGLMWFESTEGVGSTFFFKIPAYKKSKKS